MPTPQKNTGTPIPRPPTLADIYAETKSAGLTAVFTKWDEKLRSFFDQYNHATTLNQGVPAMTGGRVLRPSMRPAAVSAESSKQFVQPHDVLGWARLWWEQGDSIDHYSTSGGWPIGILWSKNERSLPNPTFTIQYRLSLRHKTELQYIPESRKQSVIQSASSNVYIPDINLNEPFLRVSALPVFGNSDNCTLACSGSTRSRWTGPGDDYGIAWAYHFWLRGATNDQNILARSIYAELL